MTSRQRVQRAVHFQGPDRIPHYLPDGKENDLLWLWMPALPDREPWRDRPDGRQRRVDAWGVTWETLGGGSFGEAVDWPLADITRHTEYVLPAINAPERFAGARQAVEQNNSADNPKYCLGVMPASSLHEGTHNLMGLANLFQAFYEQPRALKEWLDRLAAAQRDSIRSLADIGCDGVMGYDDWGLQDRLMISRQLIEEFYLPHYRENWRLARELDMDVWLHSCGKIDEILPLLADAGLNVIQQDQQENMGLDTLDRVAGGRLAFWGPVDIQKTMVTGAAAEIEAYVKRMIATVGSHRGGLISMAYSTPDAVQHSPENIAAMCAAFRKWGVYPAR